MIPELPCPIPDVSTMTTSTPDALASAMAGSTLAESLDARLSSGQRADEAAVMPRAVHADAVAEEGASGALAGWVDTDDGHALVGSVEEESAEEFVSEGRLPGTPGPSDPDNRDAAGATFVHQGFHLGRRARPLRVPRPLRG